MIYTFWMKIVYVILLLAAVLFSILYLRPFSVLLLLILLILPVLMFLSVVYIRLHLKTSIHLTGSTYHRNKPQSVQLIIENTGFLPVGKAVASVVCISSMSGLKIPVRISFPIPARNQTTVEFQVTASHCGLNKMKIQRICFTDYIHLFQWKMRVHSEADLLILPSGTDLNYAFAIPGSETDEESSIYSKRKPGDDPSEVYRIREYQPGDLQKRIHWKLSSRTDTVWVKEYSFPIQHRTAVILDYSVRNTCTAERFDTALETAFTLSTAFIKQNIPLTLYWYDAATEQLVWNELHTLSELNDCFGTILMQPPAQGENTMIKQITEQASLRNINAVWFCTPQYIPEDIQILSGFFQNGRLCVLTAEKPEKDRKPLEYIVYIDQQSISETLRKVSGSEEVQM